MSFFPDSFTDINGQTVPLRSDNSPQTLPSFTLPENLAESQLVTDIWAYIHKRAPGYKYRAFLPDNLNNHQDMPDESTSEFLAKESLVELLTYLEIQTHLAHKDYNGFFTQLVMHALIQWFDGVDLLNRLGAVLPHGSLFEFTRQMYVSSSEKLSLFKTIRTSENRGTFFDLLDGMAQNGQLPLAYAFKPKNQTCTITEKWVSPDEWLDAMKPRPYPQSLDIAHPSSIILADSDRADFGAQYARKCLETGPKLLNTHFPMPPALRFVVGMRAFQNNGKFTEGEWEGVTSMGYLPIELLDYAKTVLFKGPVYQKKDILKMSAEHNYLDALEITTGLVQKSAKARLNTVDLLIECEQPGLMPLFKKHLETEKDNNVRASILAYMKEQGEDIKPYITLDKLRAMLNGWAKKPSTEIERFTNIPALTWDDGTPLSFEEITGLLTQAIARKMIIDDGFFSIIFTRLDERCHRPLSDWALTQWVTLATGAADIKQQVSQMRDQSWKTDDMNERDRLQKAVAKLEPTAKWSAASIKGLLSLTFHATPALMASKVKTFIRTYGKTQPAQCAQMVNVLGNVSSDTTLQLLVMISKNHNKAGVKALAGQLVEQEAEKRNLTPEQLEDKAIPTLDFDMEGERRFEEVDRLFMLDEHLTPQMRKLDYTPIKSIPASADKEVKAEISNMKKMLKEVAKEQPKRLMLALMSNREWTWDDWRNDYWYHPLMRLLCGRALWEMTLQDGSSVVVRPCEDDFLTSYGESIPQVFTKVKLVHASSLPQQERTAWKEHFEEFEVTPLPWQFTTCQMPEDEMTTTVKWTGLNGFLWDDSMFVRTMRGFGFTSGEVLDAGGIEGFTFQTDGGITVQVFTSWYNAVILNEPVAITGVTFSKKDEPMFFKDVPPGLLHNVISFLEGMKDKGSYDEHWRKKVII